MKLTVALRRPQLIGESLATMWKILGCLLLVPGITSAAEMTPVPKTEGFCSTNQETYCYEWALTSSESIRFVANGDEDVIEYSFYRAKAENYKKMADVFPVLEDSAHSGQLFWAYPWDITDIRITLVAGQPAILGTKNHKIKVTDEYDTPISDEIRTAVLFVGSTTQPESHVEPLTFEPLLITDLCHGG